MTFLTSLYLNYRPLPKLLPEAADHSPGMPAPEETFTLISSDLQRFKVPAALLWTARCVVGA